jgi:3',5'-cyclic AMP phosphodiesterase CpdA
MLKMLLRIYFLCALMFMSCADIKNVQVESDETWSFVVFSDPQQGYGIFTRLATNISNLEPAPLAAICCGDIMLNPANEAEWLSFTQCAEPISQKMPLLISRGNHDGNDSASENLLRQYGQITSDHFYYTHTENNTFFIVMDTNEKGSEGAILGNQLIWLEHQLDSCDAEQSIANIFIFMHQPLYPQGKHLGQDLSNADELHQLFLKHRKIRAVFSGHDHMFNKFIRDGITYITTGGGGGRLYSGYGGDYHHFLKVSFFTDSARINIKTIDIFNEIIDDFDL